MSFSLDSCAPAPQCVSRSMPLTSTDTIVSEDKYLGDASEYDWVQSDGSQVLTNSDGVLLTMPKNSAGTVLASTVYMWYGNVKARLKTSRGAGVVSAFILLSDVKDEIDFEFIGVDLNTAQTNFYFQALPICKTQPPPPLCIITFQKKTNPSKLTPSCQGQTQKTSPTSPTPTPTSTTTRSNGPPTPSPGSSTA